MSAMLTALRADAAALDAFQYFTGVAIPQTGPLDEVQLAALSTLICKVDGSLQPNANNPTATMTGLKLAKPMAAAFDVRGGLATWQKDKRA